LLRVLRSLLQQRRHVPWQLSRPLLLLLLWLLLVQDLACSLHRPQQQQPALQLLCIRLTLLLYRGPQLLPCTRSWGTSSGHALLVLLLLLVQEGRQGCVGGQGSSSQALAVGLHLG
jgi:hypothetical protein